MLANDNPLTAIDIASSSRLDDSVAIVTGASSGLGERFARVLHAAGANVVVAARRVDKLQQLAEELGPRALPMRCDVAESADRIALIDAAVDRFGTVDVLVNNAGTGTPAPAEEQTLDVNVVGLFHLSQLVSRHMLHQGRGSIVNIASIFAVVASSPIGHAGYCASKAAVVGLTRELGAQWAPRGVRVNAIAPGWFETEMTAHMWTDPQSINYVQGGTPMRRQGTAGELDAALLLLAGAGGSFITGQTIVVDGGWTLC